MGDTVEEIVFERPSEDNVTIGDFLVVGLSPGNSPSSRDYPCLIPITEVRPGKGVLAIYSKLHTGSPFDSAIILNRDGRVYVGKKVELYREER